MTKPLDFARSGGARAVADRMARAASLMYFALFSGRRGRGRPSPAADWEAQWQQGHWDYLVSEDELPRYALLTGYIRAVSPPPNVLDVGCGHGHLLTVLGPGVISRYHGIDISSDAIARARTRCSGDATFEVADLTTWRASSRFDVVVINEVLYYISDPVAAMERYEGVLHRGGLLIISMFRHANTRLIWRALRRRFPLVNAAEVKNRLGEIVDIKILRSR